jgi:DNA-binding NarL/FixJ family response regulator
MKRETAKNIIMAIRQILNGKTYMSKNLAAVFAEKFVDGRLLTSGSLVDQLTDRELEVFQLLGKGCETRQVAQMMTVSMKTVQAHCAHIKEKLKLTNAAELLREAVRWQENYPNN